MVNNHFQYGPNHPTENAGWLNDMSVYMKEHKEHFVKQGLATVFSAYEMSWVT